jgi:hypothetical protein
MAGSFEARTVMTACLAGGNTGQTSQNFYRSALTSL